MARPLRLEIENGIFHVTTRANLRRSAYADAEDHANFMSILARVARRYEWECHAYCLMTTHYHLLIRTIRPTLARGMQVLNGHYARTFNKRHAERTHVFGDRYYAGVVSNERHFVACLRYLALNPVAAGMTRSAAEWPWSSYASWVVNGDRPPLLAEPLLDELCADRAIAWLRGVVEPYEGFARVEAWCALNGV